MAGKLLQLLNLSRRNSDCFNGVSVHMVLLRLLRLCIFAAFCFFMVANLALAFGVGTKFVGGGSDAVRHWIVHISTEGRLTIEEVSPGVWRVSGPHLEHVYLKFFLSWLSIFLVAMLLLLALRSCTRRIRLLEARNNPGS